MSAAVGAAGAAIANSSSSDGWRSAKGWSAPAHLVSNRRALRPRNWQLCDPGIVGLVHRVQLSCDLADR
eukprot:12915483-Prorocentrum_lima.AAC.1